MTHLGDELLPGVHVDATEQRATLGGAGHEKPLAEQGGSLVIRRRRGVGFAAGEGDGRDRRYVIRAGRLLLDILLMMVVMMLVMVVVVVVRELGLRADEELAVVRARHLEMQGVLVPRGHSHLARTLALESLVAISTLGLAASLNLRDFFTYKLLSHEHTLEVSCTRHVEKLMTMTR